MRKLKCHYSPVGMVGLACPTKGRRTISTTYLPIVDCERCLNKLLPAEGAP